MEIKNKKMLSIWLLSALISIAESAFLIFQHNRVKAATPTGWHLPTNPGLIDDFGTAVFNLTSWLLGFVVMVAVLALIWGGLNYVGSSGDSEKAKTAKDVIKYTLMGLVVAGLAYAIVNIIVTLIL